MAEPICHWDKLSKDELGIILGKVANSSISKLWAPTKPDKMPAVPLSDLAALSPVNKKLRAQCHETGWYRPTKIVLSDKLHPDFFAWLVKHATHLESLEICRIQAESLLVKAKAPADKQFSFYKHALLLLFVMSSHSLRELTIKHCQPTLAAKLLKLAARFSENLQSITCLYNELADEHEGFLALAKGCPHTEQFSYWEHYSEDESKDRSKELSIGTLNALVKGWPELRCVSMNRGIITLEGMCCFQGCKKLGRAYIQPEEAQEFSFLNQVEEHHLMSKTLKDFYLYMVYMSLDYDLRAILKLCPNVQTLVFEFDQEELGSEGDRCPTTNLQNFQAIQEKYPGVKFLDKNEQEIVGEEWFSQSRE